MAAVIVENPLTALPCQRLQLFITDTHSLLNKITENTLNNLSLWMLHVFK